MQRIEFVGIEEAVDNRGMLDLTQMDEAELVTDPIEIEAIIRRAVTLLWKESIFTYDELAAHLNKNYAVLPSSIKERDELFETTIQKLWLTQKELARVALAPLPTRVRYYNPKTRQKYHGIIVPYFDKPVEAPAPHEDAVQTFLPVQRRVHTESPAGLGEVIELSEKQPGFSTLEIAQRIFDAFTSSKGRETVIGVQKLRSLVVTERPATQLDDIDFVMRKMVENGYVTMRKTGKNKDTRWNAVMDEVTKQEVLSDIEDGVFDLGLEYMFGDDALGEEVV